MIIDGEAGPEQINRRIARSIDVLLVVGTLARSLETAAGIITVSNEQEDGVCVKQAGLVPQSGPRMMPDDSYLKKSGWRSLPVCRKIPW